MKTSKKILIIVAGIIIGLMVTTLFILRKDIISLMANQSLIEYKPVPVDKFVALDFSANWKVTIKQGKDCKVEVALIESSNMQPMLKNKNGILFLTAQATQDNEDTESIHARVTAPLLHEIKAAGNTEILMKNFWSDSIAVILKDSSKFSGKNNDFTNIIFKASANDN